MGYDLITKNGYNFYDIASLLQKAIRRSNYEMAGFAANELCPKYRGYLWRRLLIISAEDCYGIMTGEIVALKQADEMVGKKDETIFIAKAITLLCYARKNRDADYFACNMMNASCHPIPPEEIEHKPIEECELVDGKIPKWAYNWHTIKGRQMKLDVVDAIVTEELALKPKQMGLWDYEDWSKDVAEGLAKFNPKNRPIKGIDWSQITNDMKE